MRGRRSFIGVLVGFILTATGLHSCPPEFSPPSIVTKYGGPVSINCSTRSSQVDDIGWEASLGGRRMPKVNSLNWAVDSLTDWTISPLCFINLLSSNDSVDQCSERPKIIIYTFPEEIRISSSSSSNGGVFLLEENKESNFSCDINHVAPVQNLTVRWYKGDALIQTETLNDASKKPVHQSSLLTYSVTRQDNNVTLRCEAHMDLGPEGPQLSASSPEHNITVYFGPNVQCSHVELREGEHLESKCAVEGNPPPSVRWLKNGRLISLSAPLSRNDSGAYSVHAEGYSSITQQVQVDVLYAPELTCPRRYTTAEYVLFSGNCTARGNPTPNVTWLKDGEEVEPPQYLTRSDAGQYVIVASNAVSSVNVTLDIIVVYPPSRIAELGDSEVELGSDVSLKCSSVGHPRPTYQWTYYRAANVEERSEDGVSRLLIHNATAYNRGSYACRAANDHGRVSKTVTLVVRGAGTECPIEITPNRMVMQYQDPSPEVVCSATSPDTSNVKGILWEPASGRAASNVWRVNTSQDWELRPSCRADVVGIGTCSKFLDYTLYKTPDNVSISLNGSVVVENSLFQLHCHIVNVAPAPNLTVRWYHGNHSFESHDKGPDWRSEDVASCSGQSRSPVSLSYTVGVVLNRKHRHEQFRCGVELNLGPDGPQPPPNMTSSPITVTVLSKPIINTKNLTKTVPVFRGYPEVLVCEADGHPPPKIQWTYRSTVVSNNTLTVYEAGLYNCTASNEVDSSFYVVEVVLTEDYLPLIAGFVAVTVVAISVVFLFIYSIYYKNTKMRRYSFKNPKLGNHNSNVAHNGWDLQFPMTKLS